MGAVLAYVRASLAGWCRERHYALESRSKELESLSEKLETGRYGTWDKLDDLVAFTIVVPTASHEAGVLEFLNSQFEMVVVRGRDQVAKPPDVFRFDATRCYYRIRHAEPEPQLEQRAFEITFEVQIKTAFEHAWSVVTHDLVYKTDDISWTKRRLAAQLKAMVEQIDALVDNFERVAGDIPGMSDPETAAMAEALAVLTALRADGLVDDSIVPASWSRLGENLMALAASITRTRGRRAAEKLQEIVRGFDEQVRDGTFQPALAGSLFQAVVAQQSAAGADLSRFPLVVSTELTDLYGVEVLKPIGL
jgi:ppGpp synthetase/RelA/SpoT-type nucleotidyltranferase